MVATVKIIPFAAPEAGGRQSGCVAGRRADSRGAVSADESGFGLDELPGQKASLLDKNRSALEARLAPLSGALIFGAALQP